jgi:carbon storage regulator CsrA
MLVLSRKTQQSIIIGGNIKVTVTEIKDGKVRLGFEAPPEVRIARAELGDPLCRPIPHARPAKTLRILIVEDDQVDRRLIRRCLTNSTSDHYCCMELTRGAEALDCCRQARPDCVVLDYRLPDIDGLAFLDALRREHGVSQIPVLLVSGHVNDQLGQRALQEGAQGILAKSELSPDKLRTAIFEAMRRFSSN